MLEHGWGFPMAVDRDGAVSTLYSVGVGPTTFFAYPGGVLMDTALGELDEQELIGRVRELVRVSSKRARVRAVREAVSAAVEEVPLEDGLGRARAAGGVPGPRPALRGRRGRAGRSPRELKQRLRHLSDRVHGERVLNLRREPVASAYRVFFRQVGIDPDEFRPPAEAAMLERLRAGRFASRDLLEDALTVAVVETGVAVRAFDADRLDGPLGLRLAQPRERLGGDGRRAAGRRDRARRRAALGRA